MIHLKEARRILDAGGSVTLRCFDREGEILTLQGCSVHTHFRGGTRDIRLDSGAGLRKVRDVLIFEINGEEVVL